MENFEPLHDTMFTLSYSLRINIPSTSANFVQVGGVSINKYSLGTLNPENKIPISQKVYLFLKNVYIGSILKTQF